MLKSTLVIVILIGAVLSFAGCDQTPSMLAPPTDASPDSLGIGTPAEVSADPSPMMLRSDEFDGSGQIQPFWQVYNGDESPYELRDGHLVVEGAFNQNLWSYSNATRFYQVTDEDEFTVETSLVFDHEDVCSIAGLVIYSPTTKDAFGRDGEWVLLKIWGHGVADENGNVQDIFEGEPIRGRGTPQTAFLQYQHRLRPVVGAAPNYNPPQGNIPIKMRLSRNGDEYEAWYKPNAEGEWISLGSTTVVLQGPLEVGLYLGICQYEAPGRLTVSFDYFRVTSGQ